MIRRGGVRELMGNVGRRTMGSEGEWEVLKNEMRGSEGKFGMGK